MSAGRTGGDRAVVARWRFIAFSLKHRRFQLLEAEHETRPAVNPEADLQTGESALVQQGAPVQRNRPNARIAVVNRH